MPDVQHYIDGAVGPGPAHEAPLEQEQIENGDAPERDGQLLQSASPEKEEQLNAYQRSGDFQPVMPVRVPQFSGSDQGIFGPMSAVMRGQYPSPGNGGGYGENFDAVRSDVPDMDQGPEEGSKKSKITKKHGHHHLHHGTKKQFIDSGFGHTIGRHHSS